MKVNSKVLAIIPARGGSKGLPRKNVLVAGGKPLIAWTIEEALKAKSVDRVVLSSDDDEIIEVAKQYGCDVPFVRPTHLATDTATSVDVVKHTLGELPDYDYVVLLQPTSPLRTAHDIDEAFNFMAERSALACVSVAPVDKPPHWQFFVDDSGKMKPILAEAVSPSRRQDAPVAYYLNGAVYIAKVSWFIERNSFLGLNTVAYKMPKERSIDIDTKLDFLSFSNLVS